MRVYLLLTFILITTITFGQRNVYKQYKLGYNDSLKLSFVEDTIAGSKNYFNMPYTQNGRYFSNGFVVLRTGDMRALGTVFGQVKLAPSHYITFNAADNIIKAFVCSTSEWVILNFNGDTVSHSITRQNNYSPQLEDSLSVELFIADKNTIPLMGYLNKKGQWAIKPIYEDALPFENGKAKVKLDGKWGLIDAKGNFIIEPKNKTQNFK